MALRIRDCKARPTAVAIFFSESVNPETAADIGNYDIYCPLDGAKIELPKGHYDITYDPVQQCVTIRLLVLGDQLPVGRWLRVKVKGVHSARTGRAIISDGDNDTFATRVDGDEEPARQIAQTAERIAGSIGTATHSVEDAVTYPVLTEQVGYPPSPLAAPSGAPAAVPGAAPLGQIATKALSDVLGWKLKPDDPKGFVGALTASFTCEEVEGHTECTWTPRTYAVQTDLAGGISGAQASIYARAKDAVDQSLPLLDGLYPLDTEADLEDVAAVKSIVRSQMTEAVNELGIAGGPRVTRVDQLFFLLLGPPLKPGQVETDPDKVDGTLGTLRDEMGLWTVTPPAGEKLLINTVDEEQNATNYRILVDYMTSLRLSWVNNRRFFDRMTSQPFFGTQLVLLSRQLSVVSESVDEVRFALDSVFIGPEERQTLEIDFPDTVNVPPHPSVNPVNKGASGRLMDDKVNADSMFVEEFLSWAQRFAAEEGPRLIQDGGEFAVRNSFLPVVIQLRNLIIAATPPNPINNAGLPRGYKTSRVKRALEELADQLDELAVRADPIAHEIPAED